MSLTVFFLFVFQFISPSFSAFLAPITKHHIQTTPFYTLQLHLKTPMQQTDLLLNIGAPFTTVDCTQNYTSTTSRPVPCNSPLCHSLQQNKLNTTNCKHCVILHHNSYAIIDSLALPITNGLNQGQLGLFHKFVLTCSYKSSKLLKGNAKKEITGIAGLGLSKYSLASQASTKTSIFAVCLSGSPSAPGVAFFDLPKPYHFLPETDISDHLIYTPIFSHTKRSEDAYFLSVKSININGKPIGIDQTLLTINGKGKGGTRISTLHPHTVLERSIFKTFVKAFLNESTTMNLKPTKPVKPFNLCYEADDISETYLGPNVPLVDFVMQNEVKWSIFGENSMVRIVEEGLDVWCLAFVDGGVKSVSSIVIGGHQLEDNLLQFDLGAKRLGFSSLLQHNTMCANFNFSIDSTIKLF